MDAVNRVRLVVAAQSPLEGDAICRFLETQPLLAVVAEVREGSRLPEAVATHRPDVTILNARLPGLDDLVAAVRALSVEPSQVVAILADDLRSRSKEIALRQLGVGAVLAGAFGAERLLEAIHQCVPRSPFLAVVGTSGGAGQTTVALGLILAAIGSARAVVALDRGRNEDLSAFLSAHPVLSVHPLLKVARKTPEPSSDALVVCDGPIGSPSVQTVSVASRTFGSRRRLEEGPQSGVLVDNAGVGDHRGWAARHFTLPLLRPGLLESGPRLDAADHRVSLFLPLWRTVDKGGRIFGGAFRTAPRSPDL